MSASTASVNAGSPLHQLRLTGYVETATLISLVFVAVPLKYFFGYSALSSVLGPVHGVALIVYIVTVLENYAAKQLLGVELLRFLVVCLIPLGPLLNDRLIRIKLAGLKAQ